MIYAKGYLGNAVSFDGEWVTLRRKGPSALFSGGRESRMHVSTISHIRFKGSDLQKNGFIEFVVTERKDRKARRDQRKKRVVEHTQSVYFLKRHQPDFEELHAAVNQAIARAGVPQAAAPSVPEQIRQLHTLLQQGALTQEQYDQAVAKLTTGPAR
ncbi:hypothetical protein HDA32_003446 [Spinactinospora alkalitolerans]|uniref:DUF4429 domain-containing protein n=1 Tax=Spinactinospora alkalitolerans TaxID=687207 RepID=A0A852TV37_9ACTN|nr:DUF4429 domain-containing protein [Spinactinospora alkalitolerans]NYE48326.1 hypothetical protein [Spinactinospora alkalitolerans]